MRKLNITFAALLALVFALAAVIGPPGAQAVQETQTGRLVGYFMTREHLDLSEVEVNAAGKVQVKSGRLYAQLDESGEPQFPGLEGEMICCLVVGDDAAGGYTGVFQDGSFFDVNTHFSYDTDDDGGSTERVELSAELRVCPGEVQRFFMNPIYQLSGGEVYLTAGTGLGFQSDTPGGRGTQRISETDTVVLRGKKTAYTMDLAISVLVCARPEKLVLVCMDENNMPLRTQEFAQDALPGEFTPEDGTAWLLAVQHAKGAEPEYQVLTNDEKGKYFTAHRADGQLICPHDIEILWPEN